MDEKPNFSGKHHVKYDYDTLWKHIGISYECKECGDQFRTEKGCLRHQRKKHE